jgi:predicted CoA-binding protein
MEMREIFEKYKNIAVVGMSKNKFKAAYSVPIYMKNQDYNIIPVNPSADEIDGMKCYATLDEIPEHIDIVNVFRPSEDALEVVKAAIKRNKEKGDIKLIWLQEGIVNEEAEELAKAANIEYIEDKCMYKEYVF